MVVPRVTAGRAASLQFKPPLGLKPAEQIVVGAFSNTRPRWNRERITDPGRNVAIAAPSAWTRVSQCRD